MSHSPEKFIRAKEYVVAANIPYYITGAIIKHLLSAKNKPKRVVFLVQKEVAWRIAARKGRPFNSARGKESVLSISVKVYGTPRIVRVVPAGAFYPRPKVDSAIIVIENIQNPFRKKPAKKNSLRYSSVVSRISENFSEEISV